MHGDGVTVLDEEADRVGQVELALGVLRLEAVEHGPELLAAEDVDRGVDLADLQLLSGRVGRLDDRAQVTVAVADDAAVRARVGGREREYGRRGALAAVRLEQLAEQLARQQRRVAREDENVGRAPVERGARGADGVAGAERLLLHRHLEPLERIAALGGADDDEWIGAEGAGRLEHPVDHPPPEQPVQVFRGRRAHAGAEAGGHHDGC